MDEAPSSITYPGSPYTFTKIDAVTGATPTHTGGANKLEGYQWSNWNGLSVNPSTGEITGTPLDVTTSTVTLTIEASNAAGSITTTVDIDVQDEAPSSIDYPGRHTRSPRTLL